MKRFTVALQIWEDLHGFLNDELLFRKIVSSRSLHFLGKMNQAHSHLEEVLLKVNFVIFTVSLTRSLNVFVKCILSNIFWNGMEYS